MEKIRKTEEKIPNKLEMSNCDKEPGMCLWKPIYSVYEELRCKSL